MIPVTKIFTKIWHRLAYLRYKTTVTVHLISSNKIVSKLKNNLQLIVFKVVVTFNIFTAYSLFGICNQLTAPHERSIVQRSVRQMHLIIQHPACRTLYKLHNLSTNNHHLFNAHQLYWLCRRRIIKPVKLIKRKRASKPIKHYNYQMRKMDNKICSYIYTLHLPASIDICLICMFLRLCSSSSSLLY